MSAALGLGRRAAVAGNWREGRCAELTFRRFGQRLPKAHPHDMPARPDNLRDRALAAAEVAPKTGGSVGPLGLFQHLRLLEFITP